MPKRPTRKSVDWIFKAPKRPRIGMQVLILSQAAAKTLSEFWGVPLEPGTYEYRGKSLGFVQTAKLWDPKKLLAMQLKGRQHTWGLRCGLMVCTTCWVVRRFDGKNRPCKGKSKLRGVNHAL